MLNWQRDFISSRFSDIPVFQPSQVPRIVSLWREKASRTLAGIGQKVSAFLVASNKQEFNSYSKVSVVLFELVVSKQLAFSCLLCHSSLLYSIRLRKRSRTPPRRPRFTLSTMINRAPRRAKNLTLPKTRRNFTLATMLVDFTQPMRKVSSRCLSICCK